jgi:hypothetical protein
MADNEALIAGRVDLTSSGRRVRCERVGNREQKARIPITHESAEGTRRLGSSQSPTCLQSDEMQNLNGRQVSHTMTNHVSTSTKNNLENFELWVSYYLSPSRATKCQLRLAHSLIISPIFLTMSSIM